MVRRRMVGIGAAAGITLLAAAVGFGTEGDVGGPRTFSLTRLQAAFQR